MFAATGWCAPTATDYTLEPVISAATVTTPQWVPRQCALADFTPDDLAFLARHWALAHEVPETPGAWVTTVNVY